MSCWCRHPGSVHDETVCRLCVGSPFMQAAHRYRTINSLPYRASTRHRDYDYLREKTAKSWTRREAVA